MTNIAYELGNQVQEKLETSGGISSITYESTSDRKSDQYKESN